MPKTKRSEPAKKPARRCSKSVCTIPDIKHDQTRPDNTMSLRPRISEPVKSCLQLSLRGSETLMQVPSLSSRHLQGLEDLIKHQHDALTQSSRETPEISSEEAHMREASTSFTLMFSSGSVPLHPSKLERCMSAEFYNVHLVHGMSLVIEYSCRCR